MDESNLRDLLRDMLGAGCQVTGCALLNDQPGYRVWKVDLRQPMLSLVVKLASEASQYASSFERPAAARPRLRAEPYPAAVALAPGSRLG